MSGWKDSWNAGVRVVDYRGVDRDAVHGIVELAVYECPAILEYDLAIVDWVAVELLHEFPEITDTNEQLKIYLFLVTMTLGHGTLYQKYTRGSGL